MITTIKELNDVLEYEKKMYYAYMFPTKSRIFWGKVKHERVMQIWKWQKLSRYTDYYKYRIDNNPSIIEKILYIYYIRKRNLLGERLGLEVNTINISRGLLIYHSVGNTIGGYIGENCHLHGNNCIGNGGADNPLQPTLGKNVVLGVGAKIIGGVHIADDVKVAAGAVVVNDVLESGCVVAGIPAKIVKHADSPN